MIYFIGAGPGAPDLLTLRARDLIARCPVCIYAGSLIAPSILSFAPPEARRIDSSALTLEDLTLLFQEAHARGQDVARLHSGDPSVFSAIAEQISVLRRLGAPYAIVPGVPAYAAAAAALGVELTVPGLSQTVTLTRVQGRASPMPPGETLEAAARGTLALHLAIGQLAEIAARLAPLLGEDCPAAVVANASRPDEIVIRGSLADVAERAAPYGLKGNAMILVGRALEAQEAGRSSLYDPGYRTRFRGA